MESLQKAYILTVSPYQFYIQCLTTSAFFSVIVSSASKQFIKKSSNNFLKIHRRTNKIQEIKASEYEEQTGKITFQQKMKFDLIIGSIVVNQEPYLLLATEITRVAKYVEFPIFVIQDVEFIPYRRKVNQKVQEIQEENKIIEQIRRYIKSTFYFSYKENITSSLITQSIQQKEGFIFNEFAWNDDLLKDFRLSKISSCWTIPMIQGHVEQINQESRYFCYTYLSINRRSFFMSGTRFNSRGIDQEGNPSNFVQTQEIFKCHNDLYVHVTVRGSVPLFWKQIKVRSKINYVKDKDIDEEEIVKDHYFRLEQTYKAQVATINLLSKEKSPEKQLKNRFQSIFNRSIKLPYLFFDLNQEFYVKNRGQQAVNEFIDYNEKAIFGQHTFLLMKNITRQISCEQSVLPRVNCLDCLDRTNVICARISEFFIRADSQVPIEEKKINLSHKFMKQFITIWANIGDKISKIYCGTSSVASHIIKKENSTVFNFLGGAFKSLNRYINANMSDIFKQECIDFLLGNKGELSQTEYFKENIILNKIRSEDYCEEKIVRLSLITFSLNYTINAGRQPLQNFLKISKESSNLIILNIQEINSYQLWLEKINLFMNKENYQVLMHYYFEKGMLLTVIYAKKDIIKEMAIKFIHVVEIPLKSYGALALFFKIESSFFCAINCKLQSGYNNRNARADDFNQIHLYLQRQCRHNHFLKKTEIILMAGNMNFRLSANIQKEFKFKNLIEDIHNNYLKAEKNEMWIKQALEYDQFYDKTLCQRYTDYQEAQIKFYPTYKFISKRNQFDRAKYPAWCARILYCQKKAGLTASQQQINRTQINCIQYGRIQQNFSSTHKAVIATFELKAKIQNEELKNKLIERYRFSDRLIKS